jgi:hypothetical protein
MELLRVANLLRVPAAFAQTRLVLLSPTACELALEWERERKF